MRIPKSLPSSRARSCSKLIKPSMRRLSSSSCVSRPAVWTDKIAIEMTMAMITTTTRISTSVKPLLRMLRHRRAYRLTLIEGRSADVRVVTFAAGLSVAPKRGDVIVAAIRARARVCIGPVPWILRQRPQIAAGPVIRDRRVRRLLDQSLQSLFGGGVFEVVQPVQVQGRLNRPNVALRARNACFIDVLQNFWHHERAEHCENDHHDHDFDKGETALTTAHSDLGNSFNDTKIGNTDAS